MAAVELKIPLDYERLPEFRQLCAVLKEAHGKAGDFGVAPHAHYLFQRLMVELGYQAQTTNAPGFLSQEARDLYLASLEITFTGALEFLLAAKVLAHHTLNGQEGYFCALFQRHNAHLSGDFVPMHMRNAAKSAIVRQARGIAQDAAHTLMLLPEEMIRDDEDKPVSSVEATRALSLIMTVDRALSRRARSNSEYGRALIGDALAAVRTWSNENFQAFYEWLMLNRTNHALPRNAEQLIPQLDTYMGMVLK